MSDFKAKMHKIRFPLLWELTALPRPLAVFKGPPSKGSEEEEGRGRGRGRGSERERMRRRREGRGWASPHPNILAQNRPCI